MKVCRYDEGNTTTFACPYHRWSYGLDGELVGIPEFKEGYHEQLDRTKWGLIDVPQMAVYKGSIWATWDAKAPPFLDYVGGMRFFLAVIPGSVDGRGQLQPDMIYGIEEVDAVYDSVISP